MATPPIAARVTDLPVRVGTDYPASHASGWGYYDIDGHPLK